MEPGSRCPAQAGNQNVEVIVAEPAWRRLVPQAAAVAARAARAAGAVGTVVLAGDRAVQRLNARHRGRNKPTNVLTYTHPAPGNHPGAGRGAAGGRRRRSPPGASPGASGGAWRAAPCRPRPPPGRRGPADGAGGGADPAPAGRAQPVEARMSGAAIRPGLWARLRGLLGSPPRGAIAARLDRRTGAGGGGAQVLPGEPPELDRHERLLIANVLRLRETAAADVMVPRADIVAMRSDFTLAQAIELFRTDGHSRMPVYREQLDDVVGMIHLKDVFAYVGRPDAFSVEAIMRRPLLVTPQTAGAGPAAADAPGADALGAGGG